MKPNKFIIEKQVSEFRTDNGLSASEPVTLKSLLLKLNILTVFRPLSDNFSGMCLKDNSGHRFMLINSNQPRGRQHFTIAHELYHLFIEEKPTPHKCNPGYSKNFVEQSADMFASLLLMPESGICQLVPENELKNTFPICWSRSKKLCKMFRIWYGFIRSCKWRFGYRWFWRKST